MSAEEKAKELIEKFSDPIFREMEWHLVAAKDSALICVDEIIKEHTEIENTDGVQYWQRVKQIIENT